MCYVVNIRKEVADVYIGRPSMFGNPFAMRDESQRNDVVEKFKKYFFKRLKSDSKFAIAVDSLKGKKIGCYCAPRRCHGHVIAQYLNK